MKPHNHSHEDEFSHSHEDEFSLVLSGTAGARNGDRVLEAGPSACLVRPPGIPHAMWNAASVPATVAEIVSPRAGGLLEQLAPILARHGMPRVLPALGGTAASPSRTTGSKT